MRKKRDRIGILGGTFDPIHDGHLRMGEAALKQLLLDEVWFIPSGVPAYKLARHEVSPALHRLRMTELGTEDRDGFRCSPMEVLREGNTYTSDTLSELHSRYPCIHFYFLTGGDSLDYMDRWHEPEVIFRLATVAVIPRKGFPEKELRDKAAYLRRKYGARIRFLRMEPFDASSTEIRALIREGKSAAGLVPDGVRAYIEENGLYRGAELC